MSTKEKQKKRRKLNRELLGLIALDAVISICTYFFLRSAGGTLAYHYCETNQIALDELTSIILDYFVLNLSIFGAILLFIVLFLIFVGRKLSYISKLTTGIEALRTHRMNYEIPLVGNNELTELAENINYLAETERQLKAIERNLSHDIRTPLTAILSYTEYMQNRSDLSKTELDEFLELTKRKAEQIKILTERLMEGGSQLAEIEDGRLLIAQLAEEWEEGLEDKFNCDVRLENCPSFSGQFDIEELRRVFDNLASNVLKYADAKEPVSLIVETENGRIAIKQFNRKALEPHSTESRKIGLSSIENIAKHYGGNVTVTEDDLQFLIRIILFTIE